MSAFVLAAGLGTRLHPLTGDTPKPLVPVLNEPAIAWTMQALRRGGIDEVMVNTHRHPESIAAAVGEHGIGMAIRMLHEPDHPLGTAGALASAAARYGKFEGSVLVGAGDLIHDIDLSRMIAAHLTSGAAATLAAIPTQGSADLIIEDSWVIELVDRRDQMRGGWTYAAVGIFGEEALAAIPPGVSGLFESMLRPLAEAGAPIAAVVHEGYWMDLADPARYLRANLDALSGAAEHHRPPSAKSVDHPDSWIHPTARCLGSVRHSVIGANAEVAPEVQLNRCVVWPNSVVNKDLSDAIVGPFGTVRP